MINFIDKKDILRKNKKYLYSFVLILIGVLFIFQGNILKPSKEVSHMNFEETEKIEDLGFEIIFPQEEIFNEKNIKILEYRQENRFVTVNFLGKEMDEIKEFKQKLFNEMEIVEVARDKNHFYQTKIEGESSIQEKNQENILLNEDLTEGTFLENDFYLKNIELIKYDKGIDKSEVSLKGDIGNLLISFKEYSRGKKYDELNFVIESTDKDQYILTFKGSL